MSDLVGKASDSLMSGLNHGELEVRVFNLFQRIFQQEGVTEEEVHATLMWWNLQANEDKLSHAKKLQNLAACIEHLLGSEEEPPADFQIRLVRQMTTFLRSLATM